MRLVFMGTPDFAVTSLMALAEAGHDIALVVTPPDRPKGRGQKPAPPPVKEKALELGLPVLQPEKLRTPEFHAALAAAKADLLVVVAFRILPASLFPLARHGAVNVHGSLLPRYRGAAPIQWAVINGETVTGVTVFQLDEEVDHGRILGRAETPILPDETAGELFGRLAVLGRDLLLSTIEGLERGTLQPLEQDHGLATPAPKLKKEDGLLDLSLPVPVLHNRIRGMNPYPIAFAYLKREKGSAEAAGASPFLRIHKSRLLPKGDRAPGPGSAEEGASQTERLGPVGSLHRLFRDGKNILVLQGTDGLLELVQVQQEGKGKVTGADFWNGNREPEGLFLSGRPG